MMPLSFMAFRALAERHKPSHGDSQKIIFETGHRGHKVNKTRAQQ